MTRLMMNVAVMAGVYIGGVWAWQNIIPPGMRNAFSSAAHQAFSNIAGAIK
jgi:hypothetical protein